MVIPVLNTCFTSQLNSFFITGVSGNLTFRIRLDTSSGQTVIDEIYTPNAGYTVRIFGIGNLLESYFTMNLFGQLPPFRNPVQTFYFSFTDNSGTQTKTISVIHSPAELTGLTASELTEKRFLSLHSGDKKTRMESLEQIYVAFPGSENGVTVDFH